MCNSAHHVPKLEVRVMTASHVVSTGTPLHFNRGLLPRDICYTVWSDGGWWKRHFDAISHNTKRLPILHYPSHVTVNSNTYSKSIVFKAFPLCQALWNGLPYLMTTRAFHPLFNRGWSWDLRRQSNQTRISGLAHSCRRRPGLSDPRPCF